MVRQNPMTPRQLYSRTPQPLRRRLLARMTTRRALLPSEALKPVSGLPGVGLGRVLVLVHPTHLAAIAYVSQGNTYRRIWDLNNNTVTLWTMPGSRGVEGTGHLEYSIQDTGYTPYVVVPRKDWLDKLLGTNYSVK